MVLCAIGEDDERMREFERMIELGSEEKKEEREVFVGKKKKSYGEYKEMREMKSIKKKKKQLVTVRKMKGWEYT